MHQKPAVHAAGATGEFEGSAISPAPRRRFARLQIMFHQSSSALRARLNRPVRTFGSDANCFLLE